MFSFCRSACTHFTQTFGRFLPTILLIALAILAGATDVLGSYVREFVSKSFSDYAASFMPYIVNILLAAILVNVSWLLFPLARCTFEAMIDRSTMSDRGKYMFKRVFRAAWWGILILVIMCFFASEFMGKLVVGFSVLGAALTLSMQGAANDCISGVQMQMSNRLQVGDEVEVMGLNITGKVLDVGWTIIKIETADGIVTIPNRKAWEQPIKCKKAAAPKRLILMPPGVEYPSTLTTTDAKDDKK